MKKMLIVLGAVAAMTAIQFAVPASSVPNSNIARRVTALESKVKALRTSVSSVKADAAAAKADAAAAKGKLACMTATGLTRFGDPASQKGYVWADGGSLYIATALDFSASGQTPSLYVSAIDSSCVSSTSALFSTR